MIVSTSGSCSRIFSVALAQATCEATIRGRDGADARDDHAEEQVPKQRRAEHAPTRIAAPTVATTNSPDRRLTPAASSSASSRSPKPAGLGEPPAEVRDALGDPAGRPACRRADAAAAAPGGRPPPCAPPSRGPPCARAAVPSSSHPSAKAASRRRARPRSRAPAWLQKRCPRPASLSLPRFERERCPGRRSTPRSGELLEELRPQARGLQAAPEPALVVHARRRSRTGRCPGA